MKYAMIFTLTMTLLAANYAFAAPGDIIRHQSITGDPADGIYGFAMDWSDGNIWVAGNGAGDYQAEFAKIDPETLEPVTSWQPVDTDVRRALDIGYGFSVGGNTYLTFADLESPFLKAIDPANGNYIHGFDDYFTPSEGTVGSTVDSALNRVYISSAGGGLINDEIVYFESGSPWQVFANTPTFGWNTGLALGWDRLFVLHTAHPDILVYTLDGTLEETIIMPGWDEWANGLACCRVNAVGDNESLIFRSLESVGEQVYEVEVGDYADETSIKSASLGEIKALFK